MDTSPYAFGHVLRDMRKHSVSNLKPGQSMVRPGPVQKSGMIYGSLLWLYRLIIRFTVGETELLSEPDYKDETFVSKYSRSTRKMLERDFKLINMRVIRRRIYIDRLMFKGLSPRQKQEKRVRLSGEGRVRVYGFRYWGTRAQARARLACYDHGWWRLPHTSTLMEGMWEVQLSPS